MLSAILSQFQKKRRATIALGALVIFFLMSGTALASGDWDGQIGYYCDPMTSSVNSGGYAEFQNGTCHYVLTGTAGGNTHTKFGSIFEGTLENSTILNGHSLPCFSAPCDVTQSSDDWDSYAEPQNFPLFTAIYDAQDDGNGGHFWNDFFSGLDPTPPSNNYGVLSYYWGIGDNGTSTNTRFVSLEPETGSTVNATTTTGAYLYINPADYEDGMYLQLSFSNQTVNYVGGDVLDAWNSAFGTGKETRIPITSSSSILKIDTTTSFPAYGVTTGSYKIVRPSALANLWFVGGLFNGNVVLATTTSFIVGTTTPIDNIASGIKNVYNGQGCQSSSAYLLTGTTTLTVQSCKFSEFNVEACIAGLFIPCDDNIIADYSVIRSSVLQKFPWGFVTRFTEILFNTATTTPLPTFSVALPTGPLAGGYWTIDMNDMLAGGGAILDSIQDPNTGKNDRDILGPLIKLFVALTVIIIIVQDLMTIRK